MLKSMGMLAALLIGATPALANDTMAELKTGGLTFVHSDDVSMEEEYLFISAQEVRVDYLFTNSSESDVEALVAFPMPDVQAGIDSNIALDDFEADNFLGFSVTQDDLPIKPELQQHAIAAGLDVTDDLKAQNIPLLPFSQVTAKALEKLPEDVRADWLVRGIVFDEVYDVGNGMEHHTSPFWTLRSAYWWRTTFPAGESVKVQHRYKPSVGGTVAISFLEDNVAKGERYEEYAKKYCMDPGFVKTAQKLSAAAENGSTPYTESWISYILTTGGNWDGPIKHFKLTIDKGNEKNLISFCGDGVRKTGPTTFEMKAEDFWPQHDLDFLILNAPIDNGG